MREPQKDLFAWANNLMADREDYSIQLFFMNKNSVVYSLNNAPIAKDRLRVLFLDGIIETVLEGAETGAMVRKYEDTTRSDGNFAWLALENVSRAAQLVQWVEEHPTEIDRFAAAEHDIRRQAGIFARFALEGQPTFYVFKAFDPSKVPVAKHDFVMNGDSVELMRADAAFRVDAGEQVLLLEQDLFVFNQGKFEKLFNTKPHQLAVANRNGAIIDERFSLTMPLIVQEFAILAQQSPQAIKRLSEVDPFLLSPDEVANAIEEFEVGLMIDDDGKIIVEDAKDVIKFLDVLSDNYVHGSTGQDYLAKSKKLLENED